MRRSWRRRVSTKNATATRDLEMKQTPKGKNWRFGMKLHIGADPRGLVHTVPATNAATADITQLLALLHAREREVFGDQAYGKEADRQAVAAREVGVVLRGNGPRPPASTPTRAISSPSRCHFAEPNSYESCAQSPLFTDLYRASLAGKEHPPSISIVRRDGECRQLPAPQSAPMNNLDSRVRPPHYAVLASVRAAGPPRETPKSAAGNPVRRTCR